MRASSVKTLASMVVAVDSGLGKASLAQGTSVAQEFLELSRLLESNVRLSRNLSDPARTAGDKQALAHQIMGRSLSPLALSGVEALAAGRWSSEADLAKAARMLATHVLLKTALDNGQLEQTEREIFSLSQVITKNRDLRNFLTDSRPAAGGTPGGVVHPPGAESNRARISALCWIPQPSCVPRARRLSIRPCLSARPRPNV